MEGYIGSIIAWPMDFEPRDWLFCKGQTLYINQYQALFALIGNRYGGNGTTTFSLPNLSGRVIVGVGQGAGTSNYTLGQAGGTEAVALTENQMPAHTHTIPASTVDASKSTPGGNAVLAKGMDNTSEEVHIYKEGAANTTISPTGLSGQNAAHPNVQPFLTLNYIICVNGIFPDRP